MSTDVVAKPNGHGRPSRIEEERTRRRRREDLSLGRNRSLAIEGDLDPRYEYRWINDSPGRVHNLTVRDDWDLVTAEMLGYRSEKDKGAGLGVERIANKSDGMRTILVRKPRDYYIEDKAKEQALIDESDAAMKRGESKSPEALRPGVDTAYVPAGGIRIEDGRRG